VCAKTSRESPQLSSPGWALKQLIPLVADDTLKKEKEKKKANVRNVIGDVLMWSGVIFRLSQTLMLSPLT